MHAVSPPQKRDPEAGRRTIGIVILVVGMLIGALIQLVVLILPRIFSRHADVEFTAMAIGAMLAIPLLLVYVWVPWIVDRYDPEPAWALGLCLAWGAFGAGGFSLLINTIAHTFGNAIGGPAFGDILGACISAPVVEEGTKAFAVFFMFYFMRRQFDGVVDGAVYGTFAALGFACFENILYYSRAASSEMLTNKEGLLVGQVLLRGILKPWGHPLYTSITGIGFGIARETNKPALKWLGPIGCYFCAVFLHSLWNTGTMLVGLLLLPLFFLVVIAFFIMVLFLVKRKGKIIREHLRDEVLMGNLTPWELELVTSPVARIRATFSFGGSAGRKFVDAAARLALSKWHTGRATQGRKLTVSADMIFPLRQELHKLRAAVSQALRRPVQQPQPWQAPPVQPMAPQYGQGPPQQAPYGWK
jgi:protease PrsW